MKTISKSKVMKAAAKFRKERNWSASHALKVSWFWAKLQACETVAEIKGVYEGQADREMAIQFRTWYLNRRGELRGETVAEAPRQTAKGNQFQSRFNGKTYYFSDLRAGQGKDFNFWGK